MKIRVIQLKKEFGETGNQQWQKELRGNICVDSCSQLKTAIRQDGWDWTGSKEFSVIRKTGNSKRLRKQLTDTTLKCGRLSNVLRTVGCWKPK